MNLTTSIKTNFQASGTKVLDDRTANDPVAQNQTTSLTNGNTSGKANQSFHDQRTLATGVGEDLDLSGSLVDAFGDSITFTTIKALRIKNTSLVSTLIVGGAAANAMANIFTALTDEIIIQQGGLLILESPLLGYLVTAGTADLLRFEHGAEDAAALIYELTLVGVI